MVLVRDQAQRGRGVTLLLPRAVPVLHTHGTALLLRAVNQKPLLAYRPRHILQWQRGKQSSEQM